MKKILFLIALLALTACTDNATATRILHREGYTNIQMTGYNFFACGQGDFYSTGFTAMKNGYRVDGVVCSGLFFKNATIRFD